MRLASIHMATSLGGRFSVPARSTGDVASKVAIFVAHNRELTPAGPEAFVPLFQR